MKKPKTKMTFKVSKAVSRGLFSRTEGLRALSGVDDRTLSVGITNESDKWHWGSLMMCSDLYKMLAVASPKNKGNWPARPLIKGWYDANQNVISTTILHHIRRVQKNKKFKDATASKAEAAMSSALRAAGEELVDDLQSAFGYAAPYNAPNKKSTIRKKGFDAPLSETGQLSDSVGYEIL